MTTVLKVGGSVITDKDEPETVDDAALAGVVRAIADRPRTDGRRQDLVVIHGGGSFGHYHADRHGVGPDDGTRAAGVAGDVHGAMVRLNDVVVGALREAGVPALPVQPLSAAHRNAVGDLVLATGQVRTQLEEGFVPVTHGDLVAHAGEGLTVCSGDELCVEVAAALSADRVGLCSGVPGVLRGGAVVDRIETYDAVADVLGDSAATDVTGGMAGKVRALLDLGSPAEIFGREDLAAFLDGENPGTTVEG